MATATRKHSFESSAINGRAQGETADAQIEKGEKRGTFEIINFALYHFILQKL